MAPPPAASSGASPRRPNPPRSSSSTSQARIAVADQAAASLSPTAATHATPGSIAATTQTWMPRPPAFLPNCSPPMFHNSDLNAIGSRIQEDCELGPHPPGGFLSYFQHSSNNSLPEEIRRQAPMSANFPYGSGSVPYAQFETSQPHMATANSSQSLAAEQSTTLRAHGSQTSPIVDVDNIDDNGGNPSTFLKKDAGGSRAGRRMIWTSDETMRLVSAWLKNSNDPIGGNWKRNDQYWGAVTATFNSTTPSDRTREVKQLKEQWHRVNRAVNAFQGCWIKAERLRGSGESDEQVMDKLYAQAQESARKDIERAFGVLQSRFNIVDRPARKWKRVDIGKIMQACMILHNMIIEDQRQPGTTSFDLNSTPGLSYALPAGVSLGNNMSFSEVLQRNAAIRGRETHTQLKNDLVEHIWHRSRNRQNS